MPSDVVCLCIHNVYVHVHTLEASGRHRGLLWLWAFCQEARWVLSLNLNLILFQAGGLSSELPGSARLHALSIEARGPTKATSSH